MTKITSIGLSYYKGKQVHTKMADSRPSHDLDVSSAKPFHDYYVSYDIYHIFQQRMKCGEMNRKFNDCMKKTNDEHACYEKFKEWKKYCNLEKD